jgi:very-short-patch-repair endonuclease
LEIEFVEQPTIAGFRVDFYLPKRNTVVEVDGKYYHTLWNRPSTDLLRDAALVAAGYSVVRLLEEDLKIDPLGAIIRGMGDG